MLLERNPHLLIEAASRLRGIGAKVFYIYIRCDFYHLQQQPRPRRQGRAAAPRSNLSSAAGLRCLAPAAPRLEAGRRPRLESLEASAPAAHQPPSRRWSASTAADGREQRRDGLHVPPIIERGAAWFTAIGPDRTKARSSFCSRTSRIPSSTMRTMGVTLRGWIYDYAVGSRDVRKIRRSSPAGRRSRHLPDKLDTPSSFDRSCPPGRCSSPRHHRDGRDHRHVLVAKNLIHSTSTSVRQCPPCREGG